MKDLANDLLNILHEADEMLAKSDSNGALKRIHECMSKLKEFNINHEIEDQLQNEV